MYNTQTNNFGLEKYREQMNR